MSILLTGAGGFLGQAVQAQAGDRKISAIDLIPSHNGSWQAVDIRSSGIDSALPENLDEVIHLAAIANDRACRENPIDAWDINVGAAIRLYKACASRGCRTFVFASSEWVYGDSSSPDARKESEELTLGGLGTYALTKLAAEFALKQVEQESCKLLVFRLGILFGRRTSGLSAVESVARAVASNEAVVVQSAETARCYLHVEDAATAMLHACDAGLRGVYNLAGDQLISLGDVYRAACDLTGNRPGLSESRPEACTVRNLDSNALRGIFGWRPQHFSSGLRDVIAAKEVPASP
ncbi:MAG: NAD(P)-dependent oxidoreductase [Verrucomicrobiae bacterium]